MSNLHYDSAELLEADGVCGPCASGEVRPTSDCANCPLYKAGQCPARVRNPVQASPSSRARSPRDELVKHGVESNPGPTVKTEVAKAKRAAKKAARKVEKIAARSAKKAGLEVAAIKSKVGGRANSRVLAAERIAMVFALPRSGVIRWASEFNDAKTAACNPWTNIPTPVSDVDGASTPDGAALPVSQNVMFVFRDPLRSTVIYDPNESGQNYDYQARFSQGWADGDFSGGDLGDTAQLLTAGQDALATDFVGTVNITPKYYKAVEGTAYQPHGPTQYCGRLDDDRRWVWMDVTTNAMQVSATFLGTGDDYVPGAYVLAVDYWDPINGLTPNVAQIAAAGFGGGTLLDLPPVPGVPGCYVSFKAIINASPLFGVGITLVYYSLTPGSVFRHLPLPDFDNNAAVVEGIRIHAVALRYCNLSSELNNQGQVTSLQCPVGSDWLDFVVGGMSSLSTAADADTRNTKNGCYGFLKPTQTSDFDYKRYFRVEAGDVVDSAYPLQPESAFLCSWQAINISAGRSMFYEQYFAFEYQSVDQWRDLELATESPQAYKLALAMVKDMPQWHENPMHLSDILSFVKKAGNALAPVADAVGQMLATTPDPRLQVLGRGMAGASRLWSALVPAN